MMHPEVDPVQYELLRLATINEIPFNQCEMAYHLFSNMEGVEQSYALGYVAHACERAKADGTNVLLNPFYPYLGKKHPAQEIADGLVELVEVKETIGGESLLDRMLKGLSYSERLVDEMDPKKLLEGRPFGAIIELMTPFGQVYRFMKLHSVISPKALYELPGYYSHKIVEDTQGIFYPFYHVLEGQALPVDTAKRCKGCLS